MNSSELVEAALGWAGTRDRKLGASRALVAALLLRQALEAALDEFWERSVPGLERCSARAQLITLPFYLDRALASDVTYCWHRLSSICHHHAYDLPPSVGEVEHLADIVARLLHATTPELVEA